MVLASVVDDEGEEKYPRKWNAEFLDLPVIDYQNQPTFTAETVSHLVVNAEGQHRILFLILAATGMRADEALGLEIGKHISADGRTIHVRRSVWGRDKQSPKTQNSIRDIDIHPSAAAMLQAFIGDRKSGFLFQTRKGEPLLQTNILRRHLHRLLQEIGAPIAGFHAFRRFRTTHLRKQMTPSDLIRFWIGHAEREITDVYTKVREDISFRQEWAEKAGLGFQIESLGADVAPNRSCAPSESACGATGVPGLSIFGQNSQTLRFSGEDRSFSFAWNRPMASVKACEPPSDR
jgi:integrase